MAIPPNGLRVTVIECESTAAAAGGNPMHRRDFLKAGASALLLGPFVLGSNGAGSPSDPYTRAFFEERVGTWFEVGPARFVELVAVEDGPRSSLLDQFTLAFRGDTRDVLPDGIRPVRSESGEAFELFLQRRQDDADGARYAASFAVMRPLGASCAQV
jgi:hypothetical protein